MLNRNAFPMTNTALRLRTGLQAGALSAALALVGAAGLAASATAAPGMATAAVSSPVTIDVRLNTDLLAYDLAWSDHTDAARQAVADQIIAAMTDPACPYIIELRQLPAAWRPLAADFATASPMVETPNSARRRATTSTSTNTLRDMNGAAVDRNKARLGRLNYEREIEAALLDILTRVRAQRPGALLTISNFVPPESFGARAGSYSDLLEEIDFVVVQMPKSISSPTASTSNLSRRSRGAQQQTPTIDFNRIFAMAGAPDNMWVLVEQGGVWTAVDDDPLPVVLDEGPEAAEMDWSGENSDDAPGDNSDPDPSDLDTDDAPITTPPPVVIEPGPPPAPDVPADPPADVPDDPVDQNFGSDDNGQPDAPADDMGDDAEPGPTDGLPDPPADDDDDQAPPPPPSDDDDDDTVTNPGGGIDAPPSDDDGGADDQPDDPPADDMPDDQPDEQPDINTGAAPLLLPGAGFIGLTPQPAPIGSGPGSDAQAIARWDVVPFQTFEDEFPIGVVAFHINGIDRVEFSVDGGPWASVYEMTLNPRTGVWEYVAMLDADEFDEDGMVEVRAVAYPNAGVPRVLSGPINMALNDARIRGEFSMFLSANAGGTLQEPVRWVAMNGNDDTGDGTANKPFATIGKAAGDIQDDHGLADGGVIYLKPGNYEYNQTSYGSIPSTSERWLTIAGAPGQPREAARITSSSGNGLRTKLVRLNNLTLTGTTLPTGGSANYNRLWMDDIIVSGLNPTDASTVIRGAHWSGGLFSTDVHYKNSLRAVKEGELTRNALITEIGGDAFREVRGLAINCEVRNLLNLDGTHNDVMQFNAPADGDPFENIIIYGIKAVDNIAGQSFFIATQVPIHRDIAVVNYITAATGGGGAQWSDPADHVLFWNYTILNQSFVIRDGGQTDQSTNITNLSMRNCVFNALKMSHSGASPSMDDQRWAKNNHYIDMETFGSVAPGEGATTGGTYNQLFVNPAAHNYKPKPGSILANRVTIPLVPVDAEQHPQLAPASIGALAEAGDQ